MIFLLRLKLGITTIFFIKTNTMTPRSLTDKEYALLKKKLHQAHDKVIKVTLHQVEAMSELLEKIVMPQLKGVKIDLDALKLDTTSYIRPNLQVFFSDIVYLTTIFDEIKDIKQPVNVAFLVEHKSDMPSELALRLQILDYITAIMKKNYDKETDTTIAVLPIVFNQFEKEWISQSLRSLFPQLSEMITRCVPDYDYLIINLATLSDEIMDSLDKFGILKAALLAMRYVRNKEFLKQHFEEIFLFLQQHPEKIDLRDQLIAYLLGQSDLTVEDLEELLNNIFSPVLKQEIMISGNGFLAVAAREAAAKAREEAQIEAQIATKKAVEKAVEKTEKKAQLLSNTLTVLRSWHKGVAIDFIAEIVDLPYNKITKLFSAFDKVKSNYLSKPTINMTELKELSKLDDDVLTLLLALIKKQ